MVKYINEQVKANLRKEAKSQKRPTVLTFEKEINKKKNENKTVEEIMTMVEASKNELKKWIPDEELRYNQLIAEYQANTWKEIVRELSSPKYNIEVSLKFVKTVRGFVSKDEMIIPFIQEFYNCVDKTKLDWQSFVALQNMSSFNYFNEYLKMKRIATNLQKEAQKDVPPFEKFVLNYKGLTIKEVKSIYQEEVEKSEMKFKTPTKVEIVEKEFEKVFLNFTKDESKAQLLLKLFEKTALGQNQFDEKDETFSITDKVQKIQQVSYVIINRAIKDEKKKLAYNK